MLANADESCQKRKEGGAGSRSDKSGFLNPLSLPYFVLLSRKRVFTSHNRIPFVVSRLTIGFFLSYKICLRDKKEPVSVQIRDEKTAFEKNEKLETNKPARIFVASRSR